MMGAVATAARAGGANTIGVIPKHLVHREVADVDADELVVTDTMRQRKQVMEDRADAFLTLPGGIGTLEEVFEAWTGGYLGQHTKPMAILDPGGHYTGLFTWLTELHDRGLVPQQARDLSAVTPDLDEAVAALSPEPPQGAVLRAIWRKTPAGQAAGRVLARSRAFRRSHSPPNGTGPA